MRKEDCNAISVDWSGPASGDYDYVAANGVPTAGATTLKYISKFLKIEIIIYHVKERKLMKNQPIVVQV